MNATNGGIHNVGVFLPWHRLTVNTYESTLRSECNYTGSQPYWDYTLDTPENGGHFNTSPVLTDFGGGGTPSVPPVKCSGFGAVCGNCVTEGPFAKYQIFLGPGNSFKSNPRCLRRNVNAGIEVGAAKAEIEKLMAKTSYEGFQTLESGTKNGVFVPGAHSMGHFGVGGDVRFLLPFIPRHSDC
jgi:tyrosinase